MNTKSLRPATSHDGQLSRLRVAVSHWTVTNAWVIAIAILSTAYILCHLDPAGSYPGMPAGPGLTIDETFNVQQGVIMVEAVRSYGPWLLLPESLQEVFQPPLHLPDHPPLGRFWLGLHHHLVWWLAPPAAPEGPFVTACARAGSATALGLTILLVGCAVTAWYGRWAGAMAALGFWLLPRVIGHGHLAALETVTNLTCTAATLSVAAWWPREQPPSNRVIFGTGFLLGLALLTKIQAVLLPVPIILWAFWMWRLQAVRPLVLWGLTGVVVFFVGWPWLWLDPVGHLLQYLKGASDRIAISVWYCGQKYTDRTVPFWYVFTMFRWTVPLWILVLGGVGCWSHRRRRFRRQSAETQENPAWRRTPRDVLLILAAWWPLLIFSLPRVPVYDGERLWLTMFPLWLVLTGRSTNLITQACQTRWPARPQLIYGTWLVLVLTQIGWQARIAPLYLSFYSGVAGGMAGAAQWDLERNYWGDAVTRGLLEAVVQHVPRGTTIAVTPVLHQFQVEELWRQSPILRRHEITLVPYEEDHVDTAYVLLFQRRADLPPEFLRPSPDWEPVEELRISEVPVSGLYRRR